MTMRALLDAHAAQLGEHPRILRASVVELRPTSRVPYWAWELLILYTTDKEPWAPADLAQEVANIERLCQAVRARTNLVARVDWYDNGGMVSLLWFEGLDWSGAVDWLDRARHIPACLSGPYPGRSA